MKKLIDSDISKYLSTGLIPIIQVSDDKVYSDSECKEIWNAIKEAYDNNRPILLIESSNKSGDNQPQYDICLGYISGMELGEGGTLSYTFYMMDDHIRIYTEDGELKSTVTSEYAWGWRDGVFEEWL